MEKNYNLNNIIMGIQSVIFNKKSFTLGQAKSWIKRKKFKQSFRNYNGRKPEETKHYWRFRQEAPAKYEKYYMKKVIDGVFYVMGRK